MKMYLDCAICIQKQALQIARMATKEISMQEKILRKAIDAVLRENWNKSPLEMARKVQDIVTEVTGISDPYKKIKMESNDAATKLVHIVEQKMSESNDPLEIAIRGAIAGNIMDFGALSSFNIEKTLKEIISSPVKLQDYNLLKNCLQSAEEITYIADNAGEVVFDGILLKEISRLKNTRKIRLVVRDRPLINDVTVEDLRNTNIPDIPGIEIASLPTDGKEATKKANEWIEKSDITISKGQGNYEMLSELNGIFFLLIVKCDVLSKDIGEPIKSAVLKYR